MIRCLAGSIILAGGSFVAWAGQNINISDIMIKAHQPERAARKALDQRVIDGKATPAERQYLLELYEGLARAKPRKGDLDDWKKTTTALVAATRSVVKGEPKATEQLAQILNCKACHMKHR